MRLLGLLLRLGGRRRLCGRWSLQCRFGGGLVDMLRGLLVGRHVVLPSWLRGVGQDDRSGLRCWSLQSDCVLRFADDDV